MHNNLLSECLWLEYLFTFQLTFTYLLTYFSTYLPTCLHTYLLSYPLSYLPTYLPTFLPTYFPIYLPTHPSTPWFFGPPENLDLLTLARPLFSIYCLLAASFNLFPEDSIQHLLTTSVLIFLSTPSLRFTLKCLINHNPLFLCFIHSYFFFLVFAVISKCFCIFCSSWLVRILPILLRIEYWGKQLSRRDRAQLTTIEKYVMKAFYKSCSSPAVNWIRSVELWSCPKKSSFKQ